MNKNTKKAPSEITDSYKPYETVAIFGATGAIGKAMCDIAIKQGCKKLIRFYRNPNKLTQTEEQQNTQADQKVEIEDHHFDYEQMAASDNILASINQPIDLAFIATGWLHNQGFKPEKSIAEINYEHMHRSWLINLFGPSRLLSELHQNQKKYKRPLTIGLLSARLGSVSDNRSGGWHSYRSSKAALNMMIKNFAIETQRNRLPWISVAIQPGTTQSSLSAPFIQHLKSVELQTPEFTAEAIWHQLCQLNTADHNGEFIDFEGNIIAP